MESTDITIEDWAIRAVGQLAIVHARLEEALKELARGLGVSPCPESWAVLDAAVRAHLTEQPVPPWAARDVDDLALIDGLDQCGVFFVGAQELIAAASGENIAAPTRFDQQAMNRVPIEEPEYAALIAGGVRAVELIESFQDAVAMRRIDGGSTFGFHSIGRDLYHLATDPRAAPERKPASKSR